VFRFEVNAEHTTACQKNIGETMSRIWKYELAITDEQTLEMPRGAKVLSVANQGGKLCLWAEVDQSERIVVRHFLIVGTGHQITEDFELRKFVGSVLIDPFVWHVFEVL